MLLRQYSHGLTSLSGTITGNPKAMMEYIHFHENIVKQYGIDLIGWPFLEKFICPSSLGKSLPIVSKVLDALHDDTCKFVKLSPEELDAKITEYEADVASGKI